MMSFGSISPPVLAYPDPSCRHDSSAVEEVHGPLADGDVVDLHPYTAVADDDVLSSVAVQVCRGEGRSEHAAVGRERGAPLGIACVGVGLPVHQHDVPDHL